jgi:tRNA modification GTPase
MASNGEFTKRAFLNGKMDLSQAEAVADLIASESAASHKLALQQMKGGYSSELAKLREKLIEFAALMELELDFSEEDVEFADRDAFRKLINTILNRSRSLVESFSLGNVIKQGVPVAIIGPPNSGKSTLLNALLKEQRAIVSDIAGTTRDAIEDIVNIEGIIFRFIDTAGMRSTKDVIESQGINLAIKKAEEAAIVIRLMDAQEELKSDEKEKTIGYFESIGWEDDDRTLRILNKSDLLPEDSKTDDYDITMSALHGSGLNELKDRLIAHVSAVSEGQSDILVTNARHVEALNKVDAALSTVLDGMDQGLPSDLLAIDIRKALHYLGEVTGEVTTDDLLGTIFSRFCIGK